MCRHQILTGLGQQEDQPLGLGSVRIGPRNCFGLPKLYKIVNNFNGESFWIVVLKELNGTFVDYLLKVGFPSALTGPMGHVS
jgi:hypothetical protein